MEKLKTRVRHLELEQERVQRRIDETRERTRQVETAKRRTTMMSESASESANQLNGHLDERRQSLALQREAHKKAVMARRLVLLESHHADFLMAKQQAALNKRQAAEERTSRQQHARRRVEELRRRQKSAREQREARYSAQLSGMEASQALEREGRAAELGEASRTLTLLAEEEARLVNRVAAYQRKQRAEHDAIKANLLSNPDCSFGASALLGE